MKKLLRSLVLIVFCAFALSTYAFADVAVAPMLITVGLIYLLAGTIIVIAAALIIKLVSRFIKARRK